MPRVSKLYRKFNGKIYIRGGTYPSKERANQVKANFHGKGILALVLPSSSGFTVWRRRNPRKT